MSDRHELISELFHEALKHELEARTAFLRVACGEDNALRQELEALLRYNPTAAGFLGTPATEILERDTAEHAPILGRQLGPYQIVSLLGAGGMGEVYRARDSKLGRHVAIKILPAHMMAKPERRARFAREARSLAALNHPHIGAIYGLEEVDSVTALVLELVEGPTLAERLRRGPLPLEDTLKIGLQVADALETAHDRGIIHRDLKPANIILQAAADNTGDLRAKLVDFGLAKTTTLEFERDVTQWSLSFDETFDGRLFGSPAYMSPEQARGYFTDNRTDIWAFGCLLYEMLTGHAAFARETTADTIAAVLEGELDWSRLPAGVGTSIRMLIGRCLVKEARHRLHHIADARLEIEDALKDAPSTPPTAAFPIQSQVQTTYMWLRVALVLLGSELLGFFLNAAFR